MVAGDDRAGSSKARSVSIPPPASTLFKQPSLRLVDVVESHAQLTSPDAVHLHTDQGGVDDERKAIMLAEHLQPDRTRSIDDIRRLDGTTTSIDENANEPEFRVCFLDERQEGRSIMSNVLKYPESTAHHMQRSLHAIIYDLEYRRAADATVANNFLVHSEILL